MVELVQAGRTLEDLPRRFEIGSGDLELGAWHSRQPYLADLAGYSALSALSREFSLLQLSRHACLYRMFISKYAAGTKPENAADQPDKDRPETGAGTSYGGS
jgi:hypothetical protein